MSQVSAPTELLYDIIEEIWESTLTPEERIDFMIVSTLVSKGWSTIFKKISSFNMHIPCESFYHKVFADDATRDYSKCKRLTFTVYDTNCAHSTKRCSARPIRTLSYMRHDDITKLTSLNTIYIIYYNSRFPDPYVQGFFSAIPDGLPNLIISYTFSPDVSSSFIKHHRRHFKRESKVRYAEPHIGTLVVNGADEYVAATWESLFPTRERLIRDGRQELERLLGVTSLFVPDQAILVRLEDAQRQRDDDRRRVNIKPEYTTRSVNVIALEADGITFISSNSAIGTFPCHSQHYFTFNDEPLQPLHLPGFHLVHLSVNLDMSTHHPRHSCLYSIHLNRSSWMRRPQFHRCTVMAVPRFK